MSVSTCLWYVDEAEKAANFYVSLIPNSKVGRITRYPSDNREASVGGVLTVEFKLNGQAFFGLNGGEPAQYTHAMSVSVVCEDQAEVDRIWDALLDGGEAVQCGWIKDRWGVNWQIIPKVLNEAIGSSDRAAAQRAFQAMMTMVKIDAAAIEKALRGE
ncbi:putative 3-demethylubiquinone-9 3-methyltransferase (glyoxalase superfamily) [Pararhizobium capsulatum DSM 1112]|uniref:3-demethylubiquinone-9 3-methyltransferase (Glyoxalase superfamily) n=1 Tax=Pararhizobium capsulatum DSM 1112 TaxID=1121113 RepID=A0ABU0BMT7_9HYPH|nr:VOC family protein [Pararhizobium capsulatum]MDQ0319563.1 putative 3-demethylubiquinone-9 3-methyltransferase (glyoxalase superfamily) [Pararhizobium capsulatum DSM 1112]